MHLTELAREYGDKPAVIMGESGESLSYAELERQSNKVAHLFRSRGLRPGDHIAVLMENRPEFFPVVWAAQRSGLFYTPVNWHLSAAEGYYMLYSSGTTGQPKGILPELTGQPFGTGLNIDHTMKNVFGFSPATVYLCPGPLYHGAPIGWSLGTIRNGGTVVVMERFDASLALALIARYRVTHGQFVPTMFVRMLKLSDAERAASDTSSLRLVVHAAAPVSVEVKERMIAWLGPVLTEFYAGSEGNGFCVIDSPTWLSHRGSVGKPIVGEAHICSDEGDELPAGETGTVWFSGTRRFSYHNDPAKTAGAYNEKGWSTLGDMGHLDSEGYLYLADRRTDLILSGGVATVG